MISQRDILLVPFPFSDPSGRKVRSVSVINNNEFNRNSEDLIVVSITPNIWKDKYSTILDQADLENGILKHKSCIKVENVLKIDKDLVIKNIGKINKDKFKEVIEILNNILKEG